MIENKLINITGYVLSLLSHSHWSIIFYS